MQKVKKLNDILESTKDAINQILEKRLSLMKEQYKKQKQAIQEEWVKNIISIASGRSGRLCISYLRSSYITGTHDYKLSFFQGKPYEDEYPEISFCSLASCMGDLEEDIKVLLKQVDKEFVRIYDWRKEEIRRFYKGHLYERSQELFCAMFEEMKVQKKANDLPVELMFGEEMEELSRLGTIFVSPVCGTKKPETATKYFIVEVDKNYTTSYPMDNDILPYRYLNTAEQFYELPNPLLLQTMPHDQIVKMDILIAPTILVSDIVKKLIQCYQPKIVFKQVLLQINHGEIVFEYYYPLLEKLECFSRKTVYNKYKSFFLHVELDKSKIKDIVFFHAIDQYSHCIVARLDFVESLLRRRGVGLGLIEVDVK